MGQRFDRMIQAALERDGSMSGDSLVVANHLAQMKLFGIRQGVEFYPLQDTNDIRGKFLQKLQTQNKIELYLERYWDLLLAKGRICFYLRPGAAGGYRIYHYSKDQFRDYYDADGNLIEISIRYSYNTNSAIHAGFSTKKWIKLRITANEIIRYDSDFQPHFDQQVGTDFAPSSKASNSLGWIPCVVVNNYTIDGGQDGIDEFSWLTEQLEAHDRMVSAIRTNVEFFGNPTLISSRTMAELTEGGVANKAQRPTAASNRGFNGRITNSTRKSDPFERYDPTTGLRVRKVIANVEPTDRIGYIVPDPVSPDQTRFAAEYRENLHTALGGVDPLGISTGATAYEIKSLFGRTAATSKNRATNLYTYGICKVFEMAISAEEMKLKRSIAEALEIPMEVISDEGVIELLQTGKSPSGRKLPKDFQPIGLPPLGDRTIGWRWTGPVFEDSPQDLLQKSIIVRNMEEIGVETTQALRFMLPDKTEKEIKTMVTGFPFREMQESGSALAQHLSIYGQMMATPNPENPQVPLGLSINNLPVIQQTLSHIEKRLNYANPIDPASGPGTYAFTPVASSDSPSPVPTGSGSVPSERPGPVPTGSGSVPNPEQLLANAQYGASQPVYELSSGLPVYTDPLSNAGLRIDPNATAAYYGNPSGYQPSIQPYDAGSAYQLPEYANPLPAPGSTVPNAGTAGSLPAIPATPPAGIPAGVPTSVARQLFPTVFSIIDRANASRKRSRK